MGREGQAEWDGEPEESSSTAERERGQRGDLHHVIREWESKAMVQGRVTFRVRTRRGGSSGGEGGRRWEGRGLVEVL